MTQVIEYHRSSLAGAACLPSDDEIRERHLKYIAEILKNLASPKFAKLTEDQQEFLDRKGRYAPYRPVRTGAVEEEEDEEYC